MRVLGYLNVEAREPDSKVTDGFELEVLAKERWRERDRAREFLIQQELEYLMQEDVETPLVHTKH